MALLDPNNMVPVIERAYPEVERNLGKRPNRIRCNKVTYAKLCQDASRWFDKDRVYHLRSLFGMTIVEDEMLSNGVVLCDHDPALPRA